MALNYSIEGLGDKMKKSFEGALKVLALALAVAMSVTAAASAQSAGTWYAKAGVNKITPKVDSGDLSAPAMPGIKADVGSDTEPVASLGYMFNDHISAEFFIGWRYRHELTGDGSIKGTGKLGTADAYPPTVFAQYRFCDPKSAFRPYVGLGLSYAYFRRETGSGALTAITNTGSSTPTTFTLDNKFALTPQLGATYAFNDKWFGDLAVTKTYLKTTAHFSTGQKLDLRLDPLAVSVAVGYKF
jgi:outer membrane protein